MHEQHDNTMNARTVGALALCPTGNAQGSFYFMSISTGRVLNRLHATPLPLPDDVVDQIHRLAREQRGNPGLYSSSLVTVLHTKDHLSQLTLTIRGANTMSWLNGSLGRSLMNL